MERQLKVAIVTETYFPQINGVSRTLDRLVEHLLEEGHSPHLLVPKYEEPIPGRKDMESTEFRSVGLPWYPEIRLPLTTAPYVRRCLQSIAPDVVHIATEGPLGYSALLAARKLGLPVVSSYHTNFGPYLASYKLGLMEGLLWKYLQWFHNLTVRTFCPTPSIREILLGKGFQRVETWGRGVDCNRFNPSKRNEGLRKSLGFDDDDVVFIYCGRLAPEKNLNMLLDAFDRVSQGYANARLMIIGDGPSRQGLEGRSSSRVVFTGYKTGDDLAEHYACADIMAFPSLTETFGNVMLEAMASGLPVVGYDVPGPRDVLQDGITGTLVDEVSAKALADGMEIYLADSKALSTMGVNSRSFAEQQSWNEINSVVSRAYREALCPC